MKAADMRSGSTTLKTRSSESTYFWSRLDSFQRDAVDFIRKQKTVALFAEQGTGKTWIALALIEKTASSKFAGLLICQKNNKETTWLELSGNLSAITATTSWDEFKKIKGPRLLVVHYEELRKLISKLQRFGDRWTHIIADEVHTAKDRGSLRSRHLRRLRTFGEYRVGLSGTPLESNPQDVWGQMRFINHRVLGDDWSKFDKRYLKPTGYGGYKRTFQAAKLPKFMERLKPWSLRITKEVLDLPPINGTIHDLSMSPLQRSIYRDMRKTGIVISPGGTRIVAKLKITETMKLAQIANGYIQGDEGFYWISNVKLRRAMSIIRRCPKPVVVFFRFVPEMIELQRRMPKELRVATYYGKTKRKADVQRTFQSGLCDVLLCQERAGGVGIDLFNAQTVIVYSAEWSSISFDQMMARAHRRGQVNELECHILVMQKTVDARIHKRINSKLSKNRTLLNTFRRR